MTVRLLGRPTVRLSRSLGWIVACGWPLVLAGAAAQQAPVAQEEPFTATLNTRETFRFDRKRCPAWPHLAGTTVAAGTAVPFGPISGRGGDCVRPTSVRTFAFSRGKLTMTAAEGAELRADYSGRLERSASLRSDRIVGSFVVTGGTGRFAGVVGQGTIDGSENLLTRRGRLTLAGVIRR